MTNIVSNRGQATQGDGTLTLSVASFERTIYIRSILAIRTVNLGGGANYRVSIGDISTFLTDTMDDKVQTASYATANMIREQMDSPMRTDRDGNIYVRFNGVALDEYEVEICYTVDNTQ